MGVCHMPFDKNSTTKLFNRFWERYTGEPDKGIEVFRFICNDQKLILSPLRKCRSPVRGRK
jgi:hypothetical protein